MVIYVGSILTTINKVITATSVIICRLMTHWYSTLWYWECHINLCGISIRMMNVDVISNYLINRCGIQQNRSGQRTESFSEEGHESSPSMWIHRCLTEIYNLKRWKAAPEMSQYLWSHCKMIERLMILKLNAAERSIRAILHCQCAVSSPSDCPLSSVHPLHFNPPPQTCSFRLQLGFSSKRKHSAMLQLLHWATALHKKQLSVSKTKLGKHAFSAAASTFRMNSQPSSESLYSFQKNLKICFRAFTP